MKRLLTNVCMAALTMLTNAQNVTVENGDYAPDWESLKAWECPEWFKDAKFGIWAHWGPQCQAESGDWYARHMYYTGHWQYNAHVAQFGNPSVFGLKDLCNAWKAEKWQPDSLVAFYKSVGAKYFFTLGQHHDNFDLWDSPYQEWNSVNIGPKKDIVKGWADACEKYGLPLGVSMHGSHTWTWMEASQNFDGNLTKADGVGTWWEGYDPQELYAQNHAHSTGWTDAGTIHSQWTWSNGASLPSAAYKTKFQNRVLECINTFKPDMLYFDDTVLPFYGCDDSVGLNILSHFYNTSAKDNNGEQQVVAMGKVLEESHKELMMWDVERGIPDRAQEKYWQTCTCLGSWHYDRGTYNNNGYKSAQQVISMLVDIVSKNGNMLLSVPVKGDGSIDDKEIAILKGIKSWLDVNGVSIYGTRPWKTFGEGPLAESSNPLNAQGFNEGNNYTSNDICFVQRNDTLFATTLRYPGGKTIAIKSLGMASEYYSGTVKSVTLLGHGAVEFENDVDALYITLPNEKVNNYAAAFAIEFDESSAEALTFEQFIEIYQGKANEMLANCNYNTGKYNKDQVNEFIAYLEDCKQYVNTDDVTEQKKLRELHKTYNEVKENSINQGGAPTGECEKDCTTEALVEANNFSRANSAITTRFATPLNWTVENFRIPNGTDGIKNGLDKYEGNDALMLGVWNDRDASTEGNLSNARIFRKVHLKAGRYYFGGTYNALYQLSDQVYIYAATENVNSGDIPEKSIAYARLKKGLTNGSYYGIYFTIEKDQDVILGFQANLLEGSGTQEIRVDNVTLQYYGEMTYESLEKLISNIENTLSSVKINNNTGHYSKTAAPALQEALDEAKALDSDADFNEITNAYNLLSKALDEFTLNGKNQGGAPMMAGYTDETITALIESENFSRTNTSYTTRFAEPKYWTVENFKIPNGTSGTKSGLDNYSGVDCLSLGIWYDKQNNQLGDLTNARIYRKVNLKAGRYYFGAMYNTTYSLNDQAYLFVAEQTMNTADISAQSIAYYPINAAGENDGLWHGAFFDIETDCEVVLGFQVNLNNGSATQEFRASAVKLLYYGEMSITKLQSLVSEIETSIASLKINKNTGYYSTDAYNALNAVILATKAIGESASYEEINNAYNNLNEAYNKFLTEGKNIGGNPEEIGANDITIAHLVEANKFSRADASITTRFSTPLYWTTENFKIQTTTNEGVRNGLDKYPGFDCLHLGVWEDMTLNEEGSLSNACVYRKVTLEKGDYYFGAKFNTILNPNYAYIFAASKTIPTTDMESASIAYFNIASAAADGKYYGIFFSLDETQDVLLGFQSDILGGLARQEFRVSDVSLYAYTPQTDIQIIEREDNNADGRKVYYNLMGVQLNDAPQKGFFIEKQGNKSRKIYKR